MRFVSQGTKNKSLDPPGSLQHGWGQSRAVSEIGQQFLFPSIKNKSRRVHPAMREFHGNHPGLSKLKRPVDKMSLQTEIIFPGLGIVKGITVTVPELGHGVRCRIDRHRTILHFAEPAHVIKSHDMVGVGMGKEGCVQAFHAFPETLHSELRSRIDHEVAFRSPDQHRGPCAIVPGIPGLAHSTVATDDRNPLGCPRTKKSDFK